MKEKGQMASAARDMTLQFSGSDSCYHGKDIVMICCGLISHLNRILPGINEANLNESLSLSCE